MQKNIKSIMVKGHIHTLFILVTLSGILLITWTCTKKDKGNDPAPPAPLHSVASFSPASGTIGTDVTITGQNFSTVLSDNIVAFGNISATLKSATANQIVVTLPSGATTSKISVTIKGRSVLSSSDFIVVFPPTITSFSPKSAIIGTTVTITGTNFSPTPANNTVKLNNQLVTVTSASLTQLDIIVPVGAQTGKISIDVNGLNVVSTENFTVVDAADLLTFRGMYVQFERRGWPSGYWSGDAIRDFNNFDAVVGHTVKEEITLQLDEMKKLGVNTITFELRSSDPTWNPGAFAPPDCNIGPSLGLLYPQPTTQELTNLASFLDLTNSKGIKVFLRLVNKHMETTERANSTTWLNSILQAIKNKPSLELILFEGTPMLVDNDGNGINESCGIPAEPALWLGAQSIPALYVKWAIQYGLSIGIPATKLSAEAIVGNYFIDTRPPAGPGATDNHLWPPVEVLKKIFDDLSIPENQRTYAISLYQHPKCEDVNGIPCVDMAPHEWAEQTLKNMYLTIGHNGSRVIAPEMGVLKKYSNWSTEQAFESLCLLMKQYGVLGGTFWRWVHFEDVDNSNPTLALPVKKRGLLFEYTTPLKDKITKYYRGG